MDDFSTTGRRTEARPVAQGGSISETVGQDLIDGVSITPLAAAAGLLTAAAFIAVGVRTDYPIPAAFATTGTVVGAGLSLGGSPAFDTYTRLATFWVAVPFVGFTPVAWLVSLVGAGLVGFGLYRPLAIVAGG